MNSLFERIDNLPDSIVMVVVYLGVIAMLWLTDPARAQRRKKSKDVHLRESEERRAA